MYSIHVYTYIVYREAGITSCHPLFVQICRCGRRPRIGFIIWGTTTCGREMACVFVPFHGPLGGIGACSGHRRTSRRSVPAVRPGGTRERETLGTNHPRAGAAVGDQCVANWSRLSLCLWTQWIRRANTRAGAGTCSTEPDEPGHWASY